MFTRRLHFGLDILISLLAHASFTRHTALAADVLGVLSPLVAPQHAADAQLPRSVARRLAAALAGALPEVAASGSSGAGGSQLEAGTGQLQLSAEMEEGLCRSCR